MEAYLEEEYYVSIDTIDEIEENIFQIIFDGIVSKSFTEIENTNIREIYEKITPHLFKVNFSAAKLNSFCPLIWSRNFSGKWFLLKTTRKPTDSTAILFVENAINPEPISVFIDSITYLYSYESTSKKLISFFSLSNLSNGNTSAIKNHLKTTKHSEKLFKLNVYNVGQGSLSAVTDELNVPLFYFDLGGAWWLHQDTYPNTLRLCFNNTRTVILSHWDLDHVETARRLFYSNPAQLNGITWIAPKQTLTPFYLRLAARMDASGTLLLWSGNYVQHIDFWAGRLTKCNGPEKNHNGIALIVRSPNNDIKNILHPADAAYTYIPDVMNNNFDGLVATHHGANFDFNNGPIPNSLQGNIAYSHANRYGHPTALSITAHQNAGWTNRKDTTGGHISFNINPLSNTVPCNDTNCDLAIAQNF